MSISKPRLSGKLLKIFFLATLVIISVNLTAAKPPVSKIETVIDTMHSHPVADNYRWLEDQNSEQTRAWIDAQNEYSQQMAASFNGMETIKAKLGEMLKVDRTLMPLVKNNRYFFKKRAADQDQYIIYVREGKDGTDQVVIDPHQLSDDNSISVGIVDVSPDGDLMAYNVRIGGADEEQVCFLNITDKSNLVDTLPLGNYYGLSITNDKSGFYYSHQQEDGPRVKYHEFGTAFENDKLLFGEGNSSDKIISAGLTDDGRYLLMTLYYGSSGTKNELYVKDVSSDGPIVTVVNDVEANFYAYPAGDRLFLHSNWNAPNWRVLEADFSGMSSEKFKEIIPEADVVLEGISLSNGKIVGKYLRDVKAELKVFDGNGQPAGEIKLPSMGSVWSLASRWDSSELFYQFTSFHYPTTIFKYDIESNQQDIWAKQATSFDTESIEVKQVWFESKDGTQVPMFVIHNKNIVLDGSAPTYLTGYGGFNNSSSPYFSSMAAIWVSQGGVYVVANLRGGGEYGEKWHKAAMFEKKQNTFDDFIAAAEWLIDNKYTNSERLAIGGGSNGGLLVGAVMNQRPDLFKAVLCTYPLLDMLRYHRFLMGPYWISEYGSADSAHQYDYIRAYSPYQNVIKDGDYPSVLFVTGDADTRVDPCHARKMTALLQASTGSGNPVLLYYDTKAGHSGGKPVSKTIEDYGFIISFLLSELGVEEIK